MIRLRIVVATLALVMAALASVGGAWTGASGTSTGTVRFVASPWTGLAKGDLVQVSGSGLRPYQSVAVIQCDRLSVDPSKGCPPTMTTSADRHGDVLVRVPLRDPVFHVDPGGSDSAVYCRADHCRMFLAWVDGDRAQQGIASRQLALGGSPATIRVDPSARLRETQWVRVRGTVQGGAGLTVRIREEVCYHLAQDAGCYAGLPYRSAKVKADGSWTGSYRVQRFMFTDFWPSGWVDCAGPLDDRLGECQLTATVIGAREQPDRSFGVPEYGEPGAVLEFLG